MQSLCALTQPAAANAAGLLGTILLAWGAVRVIPAATRAYRVTETLARLNELRKPAAQTQPAANLALAAKLAEQEKNLEDLLTGSLAKLTAERDRWPKRYTALVMVGVLLSAASDLLPLLAPLCAPPPVATGQAADRLSIDTMPRRAPQ
jgi:hypothetical protein